MARLNLESIKIKLSSSKKVGAKILEKLQPIAEKKLNDAKKELLEQLDERAFSQEIKEGSDAQNTSGSLGGYGNLFSFFGFNNGDEPIEQFEEYLNTNIKLKDPVQGRNRLGQFKYGGNKLLFDFFIEIPSKVDIEENTQLEFEPKSWVYALEDGLSGFSNYLAKKMKGRSLGGIQALDGRDKYGRFTGEGNPFQIRAGNFKPDKNYFSPLYKQFINKFKP